MTDCPHPKRPIYATENAAWGAAARSRLTEYVRPSEQIMPFRCVAGHWHNAPRDEAMRHRAAGGTP